MNSFFYRPSGNPGAVIIDRDPAIVLSVLGHLFRPYVDRQGLKGVGMLDCIIDEI